MVRIMEKLSISSKFLFPSFKNQNQNYQEVYMQKISLCPIKAVAFFSLFLFLVFSCASISAQTPASEYRAFWVDTFNTTLNNHTDIVTVVNNAKRSNANMILAQVRRRGDAWYLNSLEPKPDFTPIAANFDPLAD